jgi:hypothetical protein
MVLHPDRREIFTALLNHFMIWRNYTAFILGDDCNLLLQDLDFFAPGQRSQITYRHKRIWQSFSEFYNSTMYIYIK